MLRKTPDNALDIKRKRTGKREEPTEPKDWIQSMRKRKRSIQLSRSRNKRRKISIDREVSTGTEEEADVTDSNTDHDDESRNPSTDSGATDEIEIEMEDREMRDEIELNDGATHGAEESVDHENIIRRLQSGDISLEIAINELKCLLKERNLMGSQRAVVTWCIAVCYHRLRQLDAAMKWYHLRNTKYIKSSRCLTNMAIIKRYRFEQSAATNQNPWKAKYPNPEEIAVILESADPIIDSFIFSWNLTNNPSFTGIREQWKQQNILELEMRAGVLAAHNLGHIWMRLCEDTFNDQTLIWFKRALNLTGTAGLIDIAGVRDVNDVKSSSITMRSFQIRNLHYLLFDYSAVLYEKLRSLLSEYEGYTEYDCLDEAHYDDLKHLDDDDNLERNECFNDWDPKQESFVHYLMTECYDVFKLVVGLIEKGDSVLEREDEDRCLNNFASFCNNVMKDYGKATHYYMVCLERDSQSVNALIGRAQTMCNKKWPRGSVKFFERAKRLSVMHKAQRERIEELIKRAQRMGNEKDNVGKQEEEKVNQGKSICCLLE